MSVGISLLAFTFLNIHFLPHISTLKKTFFSVVSKFLFVYLFQFH